MRGVLSPGDISWKDTDVSWEETLDKAEQNLDGGGLWWHVTRKYHILWMVFTMNWDIWWWDGGQRHYKAGSRSSLWWWNKYHVEAKGGGVGFISTTPCNACPGLQNTFAHRAHSPQLWKAIRKGYQTAFVPVIHTCYFRFVPVFQVQSIADFLSCPICICDFTETYMTVCGHRFCGDCIKESVGRHHKCPCCNKALNAQNLQRDPQFDTLIGKCWAIRISHKNQVKQTGCAHFNMLLFWIVCAATINAEKEKAEKVYFDNLINQGTFSVVVMGQCFCNFGWKLACQRVCTN